MVMKRGHGGNLKKRTIQGRTRMFLLEVHKSGQEVLRGMRRRSPDMQTEILHPGRPRKVGMIRSQGWGKTRARRLKKEIDEGSREG